MEKKFSELPEWTFRVEEVSAGVYEVAGQDRNGRRVSAVGTDPDSLVAKCKSDAATISRQNFTRRRGDAEDAEKENG